MRAAGLLPLLPLLLLGVSSQDDTAPEQAPATTSTEASSSTPPASARETSPTTSAPSSTTVQANTITTAQTTGAAPSPAQSIPTTTNPGTPLSPSTASPPTEAGSTLATSEATSPSTTAPSQTSGQDSSSHSTPDPKTASAESPSASQQTDTTASSGSSGTTAAAKSAITNATSPPGAVGAVDTSSPSTEPQGKPPLAHLPNTSESTTVPSIDPSQSSKEYVVSSSQNATKEPPSSSSSPAQGSIPSTSPGSTKSSVASPTGSSSLATTPMSKAGSKDTVPEAATTTASGADQSTQDVGSTSSKPASASQSPDGAHPPAPGNQTDQAGSCTSGQTHPNISSDSELICCERVQHTRPTIHLKEPRTCDKWKAASKNNSFFESFCSTAQHVFDASRDWCTVMLTASESPSHHWAVRVILHLPLDSGEVLMELKEKKDSLEELGIVNITSDKMVEDMTINDEFSTPLIITIITLAGSLLLVAAIYGCHQRFSQKKDQNIHPDVPGFDDGHVALIFNRLTEEMQTMENGYHDNPTLEVMETSSEMQEKKVNLNGELGDSWIVPLDTLMKEDLEEEEDTHL
ncbi:podocalyxin isoform X2 [Motacilla alba alba]|uniref:podocalyxin isoform X2 n=1 Tax=Motacilla alba alba TaxID=1094192 RepID=UPI0018D507D7|nr:podocalyxin isoform X2 [Motacilla alba alba]